MQVSEKTGTLSSCWVKPNPKCVPTIPPQPGSQCLCSQGKATKKLLWFNNLILFTVWPVRITSCSVVQLNGTNYFSFVAH